MNLGNLKNLKLENVREHSPATYRELQQSGQLDEYLDSVSRSALNELRVLERSGYSRDQAWEIVREHFLRPLEEPPLISDGTDELNMRSRSRSTT